MSNLENARLFFPLCENGKGWEACKQYCHPEATFQSQASIDFGGSLKNYIEWVKMTATQVMPGTYYSDLVSAYDEDANTAIFAAVIHGKHTNTPEGAPLPPPTQKSFSLDYCYRIHFNDEGKIDNMIKIWNFEHAKKDLGWIDG